LILNFSLNYFCLTKKSFLIKAGYIGRDILFTKEEKNQINFSKFIEELFSRFENLYSIKIYLYNSSVIEKGKKVANKNLIQLTTTFKYNNFYCLWHNGEAKSFINENMSDTQAIKESVLSLLNKDNIIRFYLNTEDKKITYEDFESEILKKEELNNFGEESIFKDKKVISFSRDKIKEEIFDFLGMAINSKKMASKLLNELPMIYVKESQYKI